MFLFAALTLLTFINSFASKIISLILLFFPQDKSIEEISLNITRLKKEKNLISMVDEFAKYARLQRQIIQLVEEKKGLVAAHALKISNIKHKFLFAIYGITSILLFILAWINRGESIAQLPVHWLWPLPKLFHWFSDTPGYISIPSWIIMSSTASRIIARNF